MTSRTTHGPVQDRGWAWLVLVAGFVNSFISMGMAMGSGIYVVEVIHYYDSSKVAGAIVGSLLFGVIFFIGPLCSLFINVTSHRTAVITGSVVAAAGLVVSVHVPNLELLYVTYGVITGIGIGFIYAPTLIIVPFYFRKYRGVASGVTIAGVGVGAMVIPVLSRVLIEKYTWQTSMYLMAGICLQGCICGAIMRPVDSVSIMVSVHASDSKVRETKEVVIPEQPQSWTGLMKNIPFLLLLSNSFLSLFATSTSVVLTPDLYTELGLSASQVNVLLVCVGAAHVFGRFSSASFTNMNLMSNVLLYAILNAICGVFLLLYGILTDFYWLLVNTVCFSIFAGGFLALETLAIIEILGLASLGNGLGIAFLFNGFGIVLGPIVSGAVFDAMQNYTWPFLISAMINTFSSLLLLPAYMHIRRNRIRNTEHLHGNGSVISRPCELEQHTLLNNDKPLQEQS